MQFTFKMWQSPLALTTPAVLLTVCGLHPQPIVGQQARSEESVQFATTSRLPARAIAGVIYDAESGEALEKVMVSIKGTMIGTLTDNLGRFRVETPGLGRSNIVVQYIGYETVEAAINLEADRGVSVLIAIREHRIPMCGLIVCAGPFGCNSVQVFVRDALTGLAPDKPVVLRVQGVSAVDSSVAEPTGNRNTVHLGVAPVPSDPGPYTVTVTASGYSPWRRSDVRKDECGLISPNHFHVWLLPDGEV